MKKTAFLSLLFVLMSGAIFAQEGVKVGFRASPLVSWASVVNDSTKTKPEGLTTKPAMGFSFDFVFTYGFSDAIGIRTGINIATKSFRQDYSYTASTTNSSSSINLDSKTSFTAIEVPVGLKFRSPEIGTGMHIIGHFGMNAEMNVQNKVTSDIATTTTTTDPTGGPDIVTNTSQQIVQKDVDGINFFTASFAPGAGVDWEFDWGMLEMAATYHWGLLNYTDPDKNLGLRSRMNYIALNLGYFF